MDRLGLAIFALPIKAYDCILKASPSHRRSQLESHRRKCDDRLLFQSVLRRAMRHLAVYFGVAWRS